MYSDLIVGVIPEIVEREMILDGTESNFRIKRQRYFVEGLVVDEVFRYKNNAKSGNWAAVSEHFFQEADIQNLQTFRVWDLSNHPTQTDVSRKLYLVELTVNSKEIRVTVVLKHIRSNGFPANIADIVFSRVGDDNVTYEFEGMILSEREYWDVLTNMGYTPYQLLDVRIPEMDGQGVFNTKY